MATIARALNIHRHDVFHAARSSGTAVLETRDEHSATSLPATWHSPVQLSTSAKSLTGFFTVMGVVVLAMAAWKLRTWYRRRPQRAIGDQSNLEKGVVEFSEKKTEVLTLARGFIQKPHKVVLVPPAPRTSVGWQPQIKPIADPFALLETPVDRTSGSKCSLDLIPRTPAPAYHLDTYIKLSSAMPPSGIALPGISVPSPHITPRSHSSSPMPFRSSSRSPTHDAMLHPPWDASHGNHLISASTSMMPRTSFASVLTPKSPPRLMVARSTFRPSHNDELAMSIGETVRMLEEFKDRWCLVQRVGRADAGKGVVPRFCLDEQPSTVPTQRLALPILTFPNKIRK